MDEIIDILDENGNLTGETISKDEAHKNGVWHRSIHILIVSKDKTKTLFQKRCPDKKLYPNTWDIAVGGHISHGEEPYDAAKRELEEELGLNYEFTQIDLIKENLTHDDINSNEFIYTYILYEDINIDEITIQKEEVSEVKWITKKKMNELINNKQVIPHIKTYKILNDILR